MVRIIRLLLIGVRSIFPWIIRAAWFTLTLMLTALASLWVGVPNAVKSIADRWLNRAVAAGFPTQYDTTLYYAICVMAFLMIVAGWIALAFVTVLAVRMIF